MNDLVLGIKLTADGSDLIGEVRVSKKEIEALSKSTDKSGKAADRASRDMDRLGKETKETGNQASRLNSIQKRLAQSLIATAGAFIGGAGLASISGQFVKASAVSENFETRLKILLGSAKEGGRLFDEMADYASRVPFEFEQIMASATQLAGIMDGGVDEITEWMPLIGDLAAASGLSIQQTTEQVTRMLSAGAGAADLFRERGILAMLGFQAGVTYSGAESRKKLQDEWNKMGSQFRGATEELADDWDGLISMFSDRWFQFKNEVGDAGLFEEIKEEASDLLEVINELVEDGTIKRWATNTSDALILMGSHLDEVAIGLTGLMVARTAGPLIATLAINMTALAGSLNQVAARSAYTGVAIAKTTLSIRAMNTAAGLLRGTMAFLGGPAGVIIAGATALAVWSSAASDAEENTRDLHNEIKNLTGDYKDLQKEKLEALKLDAQAAISSLNTTAKSFQFQLDLGQVVKPEQVQWFNDQINSAKTEVMQYQKEIALIDEKLQKLAGQGKKTFNDLDKDADAAAKALKKLTKEGGKLMDTLFPDEATFNTYVNQLNLISSLKQQGLIDSDREQEAIDRLTESYLGFGEKVKDVSASSKSSISELTDKSITGFEGLRRTVEGWSTSFADDMLTSEGGFKRFIDSALHQLKRIALAKATEPFFNAFAGLMEAGFSGLGASVRYDTNLFSEQTAMLATQDVGFYHNGGSANNPTYTRRMPVSLFDHAPKHHSGYLAPNERRAIITDDESVLTPGQMKAVANSGGSNVNMVVEIKNSGSDKEVAGTEQRFDGEQWVTSIILKDQRNGGPMTSGFGNVFGLSRGFG